MSKKLFYILIVVIMLLAACGSAEVDTPTDGVDYEAKLQTALTGTYQEQWELIVEAAKVEGEVNFEMWVGNETINQWIDTFVAPQMLELYDIKVNRIPAGDAIFDRVLAEVETGVMDANDVTWTNGYTSFQMISNDLFYGPVVQRMPNYIEYYNPTAPDQIVDFGYPNMGYETPYTRTQFTLFYDSAKVADPPKNIAELTQWIKDNPGRFTYPNPDVDFTADAFLKTVFYATNSAGGYGPFLTGFDEDLLEASWGTTWDWFNEIKPYLWREGETYPENKGQLEVMYQNGEVDFTMAYGPARGSAMIADGMAPETTRALVLEDGPVQNSNFIAAYVNAPHKAAAMVLMNFIMSPEAQLSFYNPENWGDMPTLDLSKLDAATKALFDATELGLATPSLDELSAFNSPEIDSRYAEPLQAGWVEFVLQGE